MTEPHPDSLTVDAEEGTEVRIQSTTHPENFHTVVVDDDGIVRDPDTQATFQEDNYTIIKE